MNHFDMTETVCKNKPGPPLDIHAPLLPSSILAFASGMLRNQVNLIKTYGMLSVNVAHILSSALEEAQARVHYFDTMANYR